MSHKKFASKTASFALRAVLAAVAVTSFAAHARDITQIRFAVDPSYPPFESKQADGKLVGFDIDLGNALCAQMKVKCVWVENNFDGMIPGLKARKFDAVLSDMGITEERLKQIDFTVPLYDTHAQLVARAGSGILPTAQALKGKRVGVEQGTVQERYAKAKWEPQGVQVVAYGDQEQVESDLVAGRIDAMFTDAAQAAIGFLKKPQGKPFALVGSIVEDKAIIGPGTAIGLRKGDADLQKGLNQAFAELQKNGTFKRIMAKYFETDVSIQ
ncbi:MULTISPECIES: ABC transporter substrate-binding protein [unclassified Caballeronia]|uniref:ABC transporter substrate-binding protein n=1 Tax=unclassified Caballeronia TaxID=2646786 RepID=UPI002859F17D|nr:MULTISPECIES: ABC transporter substrate-binding protein [unclassified Caballeronia]MDR5739400.1 ABC transporter substrate-binding protein [Caballeronia sp. LZ016]MDR5807888.1 ABC transporter substrate-binding protein [Caballeronia sp. LZ019]